MIYEQSQVSTFRRGLWVVLWLVVIVAALWTLVWFVFVRDSPKKVSTVRDSETGQSQQDTKDNKPSEGGSGPSGTSTTNDSGSTAKTTPSPAPTQLVETGAGNVLIPFAAASVVGGVLYHIRLRRKVAS